MVAAHGDAAEPGDLLIGAAGLLPRLDQRAVVEIQIQGIVGVLHQIHLEDPAGRLGEQRLAQTLQALGAALFHKVVALRDAAAGDSRRCEILGVKTALLRLVHQEIQPEGAVLQQLADLDHEGVFDLGRIDDF